MLAIAWLRLQNSKLHIHICPKFRSCHCSPSPGCVYKTLNCTSTSAPKFRACHCSPSPGCVCKTLNCTSTFAPNFERVNTPFFCYNTLCKRSERRRKACAFQFAGCEEAGATARRGAGVDAAFFARGRTARGDRAIGGVFR